MTEATGDFVYVGEAAYDLRHTELSSVLIPQRKLPQNFVFRGMEVADINILYLSAQSHQNIGTYVARELVPSMVDVIGMGFEPASEGPRMAASKLYDFAHLMDRKKVTSAEFAGVLYETFRGRKSAVGGGGVDVFEMLGESLGWATGFAHEDVRGWAVDLASTMAQVDNRKSREIRRFAGSYIRTVYEFLSGDVDHHHESLEWWAHATDAQAYIQEKGYYRQEPIVHIEGHHALRLRAAPLPKHEINPKLQKRQPFTEAELAERRAMTRQERRHEKNYILPYATLGTVVSNGVAHLLDRNFIGDKPDDYMVGKVGGPWRILEVSPQDADTFLDPADYHDEAQVVAEGQLGEFSFSFQYDPAKRYVVQYQYMPVSAVPPYPGQVKVGEIPSESMTAFPGEWVTLGDPFGHPGEPAAAQNDYFFVHRFAKEGIMEGVLGYGGAYDFFAITNDRAPGLGEALHWGAAEVTANITHEIRTMLMQEYPSSFGDIRFIEMSLEPSYEQKIRIVETRQDAELAGWIGSHFDTELFPYQTLDQLTLGILTHEHFVLPVELFAYDGQATWLLKQNGIDPQQGNASIDIPGIIDIMNSPSAFQLDTYDPRHPATRLLQYIKDIFPYVVLNGYDMVENSTIDISDILPASRESVVTTASRTDTVALVPTDPEDAEAIIAIDQMKQLSHGQAFSLSNLLSFENLSHHDVESMGIFYEFVRQGRIHMHLFELKAVMLQNEKVHNGKDVTLRPVEVTPGYVENRFRYDLTHTRFGLIQHMVAVFMATPDISQRTRGFVQFFRSLTGGVQVEEKEALLAMDIFRNVQAHVIAAPWFLYAYDPPRGDSVSERFGATPVKGHHNTRHITMPDPLPPVVWTQSPHRATQDIQEYAWQLLLR